MYTKVLLHLDNVNSIIGVCSFVESCSTREALQLLSTRLEDLAVKLLFSWQV